jgi:hypothetical protein
VVVRHVDQEVTVADADAAIAFHQYRIGVVERRRSSDSVLESAAMT